METLLSWSQKLWFEPVAVIISLLAVILAVKPYASNWPVAMVGTAMYFLIFLRVKLYSDMTLQLLFLGLQVYGWQRWIRGGRENGGLKIGRVQATTWLWLLAATLIGWLIWTRLVIYIRPDASQPWLDGLTAALSVLAIVLQAGKKLENWWVWILADLIYIPLYLRADLPWTAGLYAVFLLVAAAGERSWHRQYRAGVTA